MVETPAAVRLAVAVAVVQARGVPLNAANASRKVLKNFGVVLRGRGIAALLTTLQIRPSGPTIDEIVGAATVMRQHVRPIAVPAGASVIDVVGTGGDHSSTFNVSTTTAIVAAAADIPK